MKYYFEITSKRLKVSTDRNFLFNLFPNEENQSFINSYEVITRDKRIKNNNFSIFLISIYQTILI